MIPRDEFVENEIYRIVTGKDGWGTQHIARRANNKPLCGARIKYTKEFDLFGYGYLCSRCEQEYIEMQEGTAGVSEGDNWVMPPDTPGWCTICNFGPALEIEIRAHIERVHPGARQRGEELDAMMKCGEITAREAVETLAREFQSSPRLMQLARAAKAAAQMDSAEAFERIVSDTGPWIGENDREGK